jgi:uncharacterized repeat protein (TIGR03803 family)
MKPRKTPFFLAMVGILTCSGQATPTLTKLHDFNNPGSGPPGPQYPYDTPVLIGSELWFTTESGGNDGFGTLSKFDIATHTATVLKSMDNVTGNTPRATPTVDGDLLYLTSIRGGTGDKGTLATWNMSSGSYSVLWNSPQSSPTTNPNILQCNVAVIDRGALGKDVYFMTPNGGVGSAYGTIQRYQTSDGTVVQVHAFAAVPDSRQPFKGFTAVGTDLYFTTFTGGLTGTGFGNGAGTLCKLDVASRGAETFTQLAQMQSGDGSLRFPAHNPYYRVVDHCLYFTCTGSATQPGALMKFDLNSRTLTALHEIQGAATSSGPFPEGRLLYGGLAEWNNELYFTSIQGGNFNGGTINRFNLQTGLHEVLFHLDSEHAVNAANPYDNFGGEARGGFVFNGSITSPAFYLLTRQGGNFDHGTVLRLDLDAAVPPSPYENWIANQIGLSAASSSPGADPDGDGRSNRDEFAFGTSPVSGADGGGFALDQNAGGLEIRWTARTDGSVSYTVTGSPTLGAAPSPWTPVLQTPETMSIPDIIVPSGYERRKVVIPTDAGSAFFRVNATFLTGTLP